MKILVTGATGFIGSKLCHVLVEQGHDVIAFHRRESSLEMLDGLSLKRVAGDITDEPSLSPAFDGKPEVVFHLAARHVHGWNSERLIETNAGGTRRVIQEAFRAGVSRIVLMSSALTIGYADAVANDEGTAAAIDENHNWLNPPSYWQFAWSKLFAEREAQWAGLYGMDIVLCNPFWVVGPNDTHRLWSNLVSQFIQHPPKSIISGGVNLVAVDDAVRGLIHAMEYGKRGKRYLLCGENLSFGHLFGMLSEITGSPAPQLSLPGSLSNRIVNYRLRFRNLFPNAELFDDPVFFSGKYFYYNDNESRLALHLPPPSDIRETLQKTYEWVINGYEKQINLSAAKNYSRRRSGFFSEPLH